MHLINSSYEISVEVLNYRAELDLFIDTSFKIIHAVLTDELMTENQLKLLIESFVFVFHI